MTTAVSGHAQLTRQVYLRQINYGVQDCELKSLENYCIVEKRGIKMALSTILAAMDLAEESDAMLNRAAQLTTQHDALLVVLHVLEIEALQHDVTLSGHKDSDVRDILRQQAVTQVKESLTRIGYNGRFEICVAFGSSHEIITRIAIERGAELLVIGPGKTSRISPREKILGSTADRIIRTSQTPVLLVKKQATAPYRRILAAIDFSPQSISAAQSAHELAPEAKLQLVNVVGVPLPFAQALVRVGTPQVEIDQFRFARMTMAREELKRLAQDHWRTKDIATKILEGDPGPALVKLSRAKRTQLLCLGPQGRGVILQTLLGSVTQRVIKEAAIDTLIGCPQQPDGSTAGSPK